MQPHRIVIAGGGTAGWMAANLLAHHWKNTPVEISLVEAPNIGIIGVGEGSTPTLKRFFTDLGIDEAEWMPKCHATYKTNIRFKGWSPKYAPSGYSHPFFGQLDTFSERAFHVNCRTRRLGLDVETQPDKFLFAGYLANQGLAPITPDNFPFRIEYGYHFDSGLLGNFLKDRAVTLGVNHIQAEITSVSQHPDGSIKSLDCNNGHCIEGDFFIDCSGFKSLLLQSTLNVTFNPFANNLFNNAAVVIPTDALQTLPVETTSTALSNGWCWQIPLMHRTGNGYVYSNHYLNKDAAETELREHLGLLNSDIEAKHLTMNVGQCEKHWAKNCLGLGLSQGFIEPLEATALHLVQIGIEMFISDYQAGDFSNKYQEKYNKAMSERFERVRDYIVAHYKLNSREDSQYWVDNRNNTALSDSLIQLLNTWYQKQDLVEEINRQNIDEHFSASSWHCLLSGYGLFPPKANNQPASLKEQGDLFRDNKLEAFFNGCALNFKSHNDMLNALKQEHAG